MELPTELWINIWHFFTQKSQAKFSCLWNIHNLSKEEIQLLWVSSNLWFDSIDKEYTKLIRLLIQNGVSVDIRGYRDCTGLGCASIRGHKDIVKILIDAGANINYQNNKGDTALHYACYKNRKGCIEVLLNAGADIYKNNAGYTPINIAELEHHKKIDSMLNTITLNNNGNQHLLHQSF